MSVYSAKELHYVIWGHFRRRSMHGENSVGTAKGDEPWKLHEVVVVTQEHSAQFQDLSSLSFRTPPTLPPQVIWLVLHNFPSPKVKCEHMATAKPSEFSFSGL